MPRAKTTLLLFVVLVSACATQPKTFDNTKALAALIGMWEGQDHTGTRGRFIFYNGGRADVVLGGESFQQRIANKGKLSFAVEHAENAMIIQIFINTARSEKIRLFNMLAVFDGDDTLKIKMNRDQTTPKPFKVNNQNAEEKSVMVLKRLP